MSGEPTAGATRPTAGAQTATFKVGVRLVVVGVLAGAVLGAEVGARSLADDVGGLWFCGLLFGAGAGAVLGVVAAAVSAAVVMPRGVVAAAQRPGPGPHLSLWWQLLVPVPAASAAAWWVLQSPVVALLERGLVTAAVAAACAAWVVWSSAWVMAPLTASGSQEKTIARFPRVSS